MPAAGKREDFRDGRFGLFIWRGCCVRSAGAPSAGDGNPFTHRVGADGAQHGDRAIQTGGSVSSKFQARGYRRYSDTCAVSLRFSLALVGTSISITLTVSLDSADVVLRSPLVNFSADELVGVLDSIERLRATFPVLEKRSSDLPTSDAGRFQAQQPTHRCWSLTLLDLKKRAGRVS